MTWGSRIRLKGTGNAWREALAAMGLLLVTLTVGLTYAFEPQSPADALDRLVLSIDESAHSPNLRIGERLFGRAARAEAVGLDSIAESFVWEAAGAFERAATGAGGPREELAANDRLADAYLDLGVRHLARGRGGRFGIGREAEDLRAAEDIAACVVGVAPTQRRAAVNGFLVELEEELERAADGRCPL